MRMRNNSLTKLQYSLDLCHQDVITGDVIHILLNLSIHLNRQFNKDPPSVGNPFPLKQIKMQKPLVNIVCIYTEPFALSSKGSLTFPWLSSSNGSGRPVNSLGLPYRLT